MANFAYTYGLKALLDVAAASLDLRVLLCMTATTCDTEVDKTFLDQFTDLDEGDGANYARQAIGNEASGANTGTDTADVDGDNITFPTLGVGTSNYQGAVIFHFVTNDADSIPIAWIDTGGFPFAGNGANVEIQWHADGIITLT